MPAKQPIHTAVILGAGLGSRLGTLAGPRPKGFLEVGGLSLIERSCNYLANNGITRILIGTGHHADVYEAFAASWKKVEITCIHNPDYASTGSMRTLSDITPHIDAPFLLLESDLLYEPRALGLLLQHESETDSTILASGFTRSEDEVYLETDAHGLLRNVSKDRTKLLSINAELVGISRVGIRTMQGMCRVMNEMIGGANMHYEEAFAALSATEPIDVFKVDDLVWCEIDNQAHLQRALSDILPFIQD